MTPYFFVSHSSDDAQLTEHVAKAINAAGGYAYVAEDHPQPGGDLPDKLVQAIRECHAFVVLFTKAGIESDLVRREVTLAMAEKKWIIPLVVPEVQREVGKVQALIGLMEYVLFDPEAPGNALIALSGLVTRYRDAILAQSIRAYQEQTAANANQAVQQMALLQQENARLKMEEGALVVGLVLIAAFVLIAAAGSAGGAGT